jgi:hypothetical protein
MPLSVAGVLITSPVAPGSNPVQIFGELAAAFEIHDKVRDSLVAKGLTSLE